MNVLKKEELDDKTKERFKWQNTEESLYDSFLKLKNSLYKEKEKTITRTRD